MLIVIMFYKLAFAIAIIFTLSSCATLQTEENWPKDIPPLSYFENYYEQDKAHQEVAPLSRYLLWVKRFYYGSFIYSRGWKQATQETVATIEGEQQKQLVEYQMSVIGDLIAPEWAKDSDYRAINTRHILVWGEALRLSVANNQQRAVIDKVHIDVIDLLAGRIQPEVIEKTRYGVAVVITDEDLFLDDAQTL